MRKDRALMLGIILIAISIGVTATVLPVANFIIPLDSFDDSSIQSIILTEATPLITEPSKSGNEGLGVSGWVKITVLDEFGNVKSVQEDHNLISTVGLGDISDLVFGTTHDGDEGLFDTIGVGKTNTAVSAGHTDCQGPTNARLEDASVTNSGSNGAVINQSWVAVLGAITIEEVCLFDNTTNATGNMLARQVTGSIVVGAADTVNVEWTVTFADSDGT